MDDIKTASAGVKADKLHSAGAVFFIKTGCISVENLIMELKEICLKIFDAVTKAAENAESPVAEITVCTGRNFGYSDDEFVSVFSEVKWDSTLSAADLTVIHDENMTDCCVKIEKITGFIDEPGTEKIYKISDQSAKINC